MADLTYYAFTRPTTLAVDLNNTTTTVQLTDGSSYPDPSVPGNGQYTVILGYGTEREEIVTVTGKPSGNVLTVIRGQDGSAALAQNAGDIVVHGVSARDFRGSLKTSGGEMTGPLLLDADATAPLEAVPLQQVEAADAALDGAYKAADLLRVLKAGDTMTGPLILSGDPTAANGAATKGYADAIAGAGVRVLRGSTPRAAVGAGDTGQFADITFSTPFASPPVVVVGLDCTAADGTGADVSADLITASGFRMRRMNSAGAVRTFGSQWIAIGVRA